MLNIWIIFQLTQLCGFVCEMRGLVKSQFAQPVPSKLYENERRTPGGGGGKAAARLTVRIAARSSAAEPELFPIRTLDTRPVLVTVNATMAVPPFSLGRGTRLILRHSFPL